MPVNVIPAELKLTKGSWHVATPSNCGFPLCTHSPWMHFLLDSGERSVATGQFLYGPWQQPFSSLIRCLTEIDRTNQQCGLCSGCVLVFWFCERVYLAALVAEEQWRRSVPRETFKLGDISHPFEGRCCAFFFFAIDLEVALHGAKTRNELVFDNFCSFLILFPKWRSSAAKNLQERWLRTWDEQVNWHVAAVDVMIRRSYDMIIMFKRIIIAVKTMMLWCFSILSSTNRSDPMMF